MHIQSLIPAAITPVKIIDNILSVDAMRCENFFTFLKTSQIHTIVVCGSTGCGIGLSTMMISQVLDIAKQVGLDVIVGINNPNAYMTIECIKKLECYNPKAIMIAPPFTTKARQKDIVSFMKTISCSSNIPLLIYNNPARFGLNIDIKTYQELFDTCNIYGVKECADAQDSLWPSLRVLTSEKGVFLYSGDDANWFDDSGKPMHAVDGCISVLANCFPRLGVALANGVISGGVISGGVISGGVISGDLVGYQGDDLLTTTVSCNSWRGLSEILKIAPNPLPMHYLLSKINLATMQTALSFEEMTNQEQTSVDDIINKYKI